MIMPRFRVEAKMSHSTYGMRRSEATFDHFQAIAISQTTVNMSATIITNARFQANSPKAGYPAKNRGVHSAFNASCTA